MASCLDNKTIWQMNPKRLKQNYCYFLLGSCRLVASSSCPISNGLVGRNDFARIVGAVAAAGNHYWTLVSPAWRPHAMATAGNFAVAAWCSSTIAVSRNACPA